MTYTFRLAHLSDLHIGPIPRPALRELLGKRLTGYVNWKRSRHSIHNMPMLDRIIEDIKTQTVDHVALTGDLVNIGLPLEFAAAESIIKRIADPQDMSLIPGNHDAYCSNSLQAMRHHFAPYMRGDDVEEVSFPYMRIRGKCALIGVSSAIVTAPFMASGAVGSTQIAAIKQMLDAAGNAGFLRIIMIHHPPHKEGARWGRGLRDAAAFSRMLRDVGAELVIHGHNHVQSVHRLERRGGADIPVIGVASASAVPGTDHHQAAYHIYEFKVDDKGVTLEMITRGNKAGQIAQLSKITVAQSMNLEKLLLN